MTPASSLNASAGPAGRVNTSLPEVVAHVAGEYELGEVRDWSVLATGYEDCNLDVRTEAGRVVVKVFASTRTHAVPDRTAGLIGAARKAGVRHPPLHLDSRRLPVHDFDRHRLIVMDHVPGQSYYEMGRPPDEAELAMIVEQAARIHRIKAIPAVAFDPWAIANLVPLAGKVGHLLDPEQRVLIDEAVADMRRADWDSLPHALIHADLTAGNVLLGPDGEITVLDFALANRWPRLQELAVIAASLMHGSPGTLPERMAAVASAYDAVADQPLVPAENAALDSFGRWAAAMELLGGLNEWRQGNRGPETDLLLAIGTAGLRDYA